MEKNTTPYNFKGQRNMEHHAQAKRHSQYTKFLKLRDFFFFFASSVVAHFCCLPSYNVYAIYLIFISLVLLKKSF